MLPPSHGLTPSLRPPRAVREIADVLERAGFETWCVGGAVRDALLGTPHLDWDLATAATPVEVQRLFRRTVPIGIAHGTVGVLDKAGVLHEVTTFRRDVTTDGRHAEVAFGVSLDEDLARRDFTINAIAYSPRLDTLHDPFDGRGDLVRGIVRAVGVPADRMREDWLRALRALRFAGRFGFEIHAPTWQAIAAAAPQLTSLSRERVKQELEKTMDQVALPGRSLALWRASGALRSLIPALDGQADMVLSAANFVGLPDASRRAERRSLRRLVRLATLWMGLDVPTVRAALISLRFANRDVEAITHLADCWLAFGARLADTIMAGERPLVTLRRVAARTRRPLLMPFMRVAAATWSTERACGRPAPSASDVHAVFRQAQRVAFHDPVEIADLAIDGDDLLAAGHAPGASLGSTLRELLEWVLEDPSRNTRAALIARAAPAGAR